MADKKDMGDSLAYDIMNEQVPATRALNFSFVDHGVDFCLTKVPYSKTAIGYPDTGVLAGGVITTALDDCSGVAVLLASGKMQPVATVALRIDYMRSAEPGRDLLVHAHCFKLTRNIAFARGVAYHDSPDDPIATSVGTFMFTEENPVPENKQ